MKSLSKKIKKKKNGINPKVWINIKYNEWGFAFKLPDWENPKLPEPKKGNSEIILIEFQLYKILNEDEESEEEFNA